MLHAQLHLDAALTRRTNGRSLGNSQQSNVRTFIGQQMAETQRFLRVNQERLSLRSTNTQIMMLVEHANHYSQSVGCAAKQVVAMYYSYTLWQTVRYNRQRNLLLPVSSDGG
jgi:hypothetical protein